MSLSFTSQIQIIKYQFKRSI